jgi:stringent starvation protein B
MHEWMVDNGFTPHIVVDASREGVQVPDGHVQDGKIVLNVSPSATRSLSLGNDSVSFEARFNGTPHLLRIPVMAVLGIYARETGQGMIFGDDDDSPPSPQPPDAGASSSHASRRPKLKVVK